MSGYATLPPAWRTTPADAERWIAASLDHVGALPAKATGAKRRSHRDGGGGEPPGGLL
jgi:hypothetical protein